MLTRPQQTLLLVGIGVASVVLIGYHGLYAGQRKRVELIRGYVAQEQADQQATSNVAVLLAQLEQYRRRLAPEPDTSWLVKQVVSVSQDAGVQLASITQETPEAQQEFTRLTIHLQFSSNYHQLGQFLDRLEHAPPFIRVDRLEVTEPEGGHGPAMIGLVLSTFYVPEGTKQRPVLTDAET